MASTTPTQEPPSSRDRRLRSRSPRSRPTTPLRPSSRSSLRDSAQRSRGAASSSNALEGLQDGFAELSDAMADLEQNFVQLQLMHESLARFSESFAGFLYGMNMNAFCVDFSEASTQCTVYCTCAWCSGGKIRADADMSHAGTSTRFIQAPAKPPFHESLGQSPQSPRVRRRGRRRYLPNNRHIFCR